MKRCVFTIIFLTVHWVTGNSASFFSGAEQGIGLREYITTAQGLGMGGTGLAMPDSTALNAYNIATWRHIGNTRISILMRTEYNQIDFGWQNFSRYTGAFSGLQLAVPLQEDKWFFGISLAPYTVVDFNHSQEYHTPLGNYQEDTFYNGNLARAQVSLAWSPHPRLGIAASFNYYFGTIKDRYRLIFNQRELFDSSYEIEYQFHGPGAGISVEYDILHSLHIGGFFDFKPSLSFSKISRSPIAFTEEEIRTNSSLPVFGGIGSSFRFAGVWTVNADLAYQNWSDGFDIEGVDLNRLEDWYRAGIGIERAHSRGETESLLNKIDLRTGFSLGNTGYRFNDHSVREYSAHLGIGIPFYQDKARLDIAFLTGIRGDRSTTIAQERFFRFVFSISAGELWFQKLR